MEAHKFARRPGSHFLNNRLTDGSEIVKPYAPAALYPQEDFWYLFLLGAESTKGHSATGRIRSIKCPMTSSGIEPATFRLVA
jgi:hypothetical protein